jgi:hypothetical protein
MKTALNEEAGQDGTRPTEVNTSDSDEWIRPGSIRSRNARPLDVDEVLARSLPKASGKVFRISAIEGSSPMKE